MDLHEKRSQAIVDTMVQVKSLLEAGASVDTLNRAKDVLGALALQRELFPEDDFPWPTDEAGNNCWCLYSEKDGRFALYLDLIHKGQGTVPHDHDSWGIVTGVEGQEKHYLFKRVDGGSGPGTATLECAGAITIGAGESVSMLADGIHAIEAVGGDRSMMLHCYEKGFQLQRGRLEFDTTTDTCFHSVDAAGDIRDFPLHPEAVVS